MNKEEAKKVLKLIKEYGIPLNEAKEMVRINFHPYNFGVILDYEKLHLLALLYNKENSTECKPSITFKEGNIDDGKEHGIWQCRYCEKWNPYSFTFFSEKWVPCKVCGKSQTVFKVGKKGNSSWNVKNKVVGYYWEAQMRAKELNAEGE